MEEEPPFSRLCHEMRPVMPLAITNIRPALSSLMASQPSPRPLNERAVDRNVATAEDDIATVEEGCFAGQPIEAS